MWVQTGKRAQKLDVDRIKAKSMTSPKQIEANRQNAIKSTGPRTDVGKARSRLNALRHGLTAETVIAAIEDTEDYKAFELSIISDFNVTTAVERELTLRLASVLWRLRRTTAIETGLLQIQGDIMRDRDEKACNSAPVTQRNRYSISSTVQIQSNEKPDEKPSNSKQPTSKNVSVGRCYLRLANFDNDAFEKLSRYETSLWRQTYSLLYSLGHLLRRN